MQILYSHDWTSTFCIGKLTPEEKKSKDRKVSWILVNSRFDSSFVKLDILPESLYHEDIDCTEKSVTCIGVFLFLLAKSCDNSWPYLFEDGWQWQKAQVNYLDFWSWEKFDCWAVEKSWVKDHVSCGTCHKWPAGLRYFSWNEQYRDEFGIDWVILYNSFDIIYCIYVICVCSYNCRMEFRFGRKLQIGKFRFDGVSSLLD